MSLVRKIKRRLVGSNGAVAVIVALLITAIVGMTALVVDMGSLYEDRRSLQGVADAAALAGAQELPESRTKATQKVMENIEKNYNDDNVSVDIEFSSFMGAPDASIKVTVSNPDSPLYFGRIYGSDSENVSANATAVVASPVGLSDLVPWGAELEEGESLDDWLDGAVTKTLKFGAGGAIMGNFRALDLDNHHGGGSNDYTDRIIYGYNEVLYVEDEILPETGNMATTVNATETRIANGGGWDTWENLTETADDGTVTLRVKNGQFCMVPVIYKSEIPPGQSEHIEIIAFAPFIIIDIDPPHPPGKANIIGRFVTRAMLVQEGAIEGVTATGFRVIRLWE